MKKPSDKRIAVFSRSFGSAHSLRRKRPVVKYTTGWAGMLEYLKQCAETEKRHLSSLKK